MKTKVLNPKKIEIKWHVIDANNQVLGRVASKVAKLLIGKNKVEYTPNHSIADKVVVINSSKIKVTGNKSTSKVYYRHSNYPGGLKSETFEKRIVRRPNDVIRDAVKGMLPINRLRDVRITNLYVYEGDTHPHAGQVKL